MVALLPNCSLNFPNATKLEAVDHKFQRGDEFLLNLWVSLLEEQATMKLSHEIPPMSYIQCGGQGALQNLTLS